MPERKNKSLPSANQWEPYAHFWKEIKVPAKTVLLREGALTKGFIDRVIFPGIAYKYEKENKMVPRLGIKGITLITTMNTPSILYRLFFRNAIRHAVFTGTFWKLGYKNRKWISLNMVKFVSQEKRKNGCHKWNNGLPILSNHYFICWFNCRIRSGSGQLARYFSRSEYLQTPG